MKNTEALTTIEEAVTVGLTCVEQGLEDKETVRRNIIEAVGKSYVPVRSLEDIPLDVLMVQHDVLGLGVVIRAGKIVGYSVENILNYEEAVWRALEFNGMVSLICANNHHKGGK